MTERVCNRPSRQADGLVRTAKGVWPVQGEPMTSRKEPPAKTGGRRDGRSHAGQPETPPSSPGTPPRVDPAFAPQKQLNARDHTRLSHAFPSTLPAAPELTLPCDGTVGGDDMLAARNTATLKAALGLLAHSDTGRDLMVELAKAGYRVQFDDTRTAARGASGLCDPKTKTIVLKSIDDRDTLALLLAHEAVHALQNERADDLLPSARHRPETVFRLAFAIEADAYAQQIQVAFELARSHTAQRPLLLMRTRFPALARAADRTLIDQGAGALHDGRMLASVFSAFYDDFTMRSYYERVHLDFITSFASARKLDQLPDAPKGKTRDFNTAASGLSDLFRRDMTSDKLKSLLQWRGKAYLQEHRADLDFASPRFGGLSAPTRTGVENFYKTYLPGRKMPALATFGLYVVAAGQKAAPENITDKTPLLPGKPGAKGGSTIRAPRKPKWDFW